MLLKALINSQHVNNKHANKQLVNCAGSHITLQPKSDCPLKLSRAEPGQYLDGRPPGKTRLLLEEVIVRPASGAHLAVCVGPNLGCTINISYKIFNEHLVSKPLFTDKLRRTTFIVNLDLRSLSVNEMLVNAGLCEITHVKEITTDYRALLTRCALNIACDISCSPSPNANVLKH